ncbi:MAG: hypothetical protein U1E05_11400 [Patescibacteria group bacterium]|nr:hypothetical protein [Patescibacteria group bacterium]
MERVPPAVWHYDVSGKHVPRQWFTYRQKDRSRPIMGLPPPAVEAGRSTARLLGCSLCSRESMEYNRYRSAYDRYCRGASKEVAMPLTIPDSLLEQARLTEKYAKTEIACR